MYAIVLWQVSLSTKKDFSLNHDMRVWKELHPSVSLFFERRFQAFVTRRDDIESAKFTYAWRSTLHHVDFSRMTQTNSITGRAQRVQRVLFQNSTIHTDLLQFSMRPSSSSTTPPLPEPPVSHGNSSMQTPVTDTDFPGTEETDVMTNCANRTPVRPGLHLQGATPRTRMSGATCPRAATNLHIASADSTRCTSQKSCSASTCTPESCTGVECMGCAPMDEVSVVSIPHITPPTLRGPMFGLSEEQWPTTSRIPLHSSGSRCHSRGHPTAPLDRAEGHGICAANPCRVNLDTLSVATASIGLGLGRKRSHSEHRRSDTNIVDPRCHRAATSLQASWRGFRARTLFRRWISLQQTHGFEALNPIQEFIAKTHLH
jgi:hypothetical protein